VNASRVPFEARQQLFLSSTHTSSIKDPRTPMQKELQPPTQQNPHASTQGPFCSCLCCHQQNGPTTPYKEGPRTPMQKGPPTSPLLPLQQSALAAIRIALQPPIIYARIHRVLGTCPPRTQLSNPAGHAHQCRQCHQLKRTHTDTHTLLQCCPLPLPTATPTYYCFAFTPL
jgi:hypothetical protein